MAAIKFDITGDNHNLLESFNGVKRGVREMSQTIEQEGISIEKMFERIKTAAALSIAGFSAKEFVQQVATVRGEFQKLEVAFTTMLGSADKANALMNQLVQTAATTPFDLQGVAGGAKQLLAYGVAADEVNDTLIHLGDIAAGLSLPLNDLVYLYGTTITQGRMFTMDLRQFMGRGIPLADELAKQFGVAKSEVAGLVSAGKVGAEEFKEAIMSMSSEGGKFSGLMEAQSKTISGQISNLEDAVGMMFNEIGKNTQDIISGGIEMAASLVENWKTVGAAILAVVEAVGIYKATLATMAAVNKATTNIGYDAEIAELSKIVPMKEAEANADLQVAVAEGRLTQSKADQIAALRAEAAEELKALTIKETAAKANYQMAVEQHLIAKRNMSVAQSQVKIAIESGTAEEIAAAKRGAATAKQELQTAAIAKNTASKELNTISTQKNAISNGLDAASSTGAATATGVLTAAKLALKRAIDMVNASFLASPIFWIAAVIAGVTFSIYKLVTAESAEERARRKANEQMDEFNKKMEEQNQQVEKLIGIIQSETATEYQRLEAYEKLKRLMPSLTDKYSQAEIAELDLAEAQKDMNKNMDEAKFEHAKEEVEKYKESIKMLQEQMLQDAKYGGRNAIYYTMQISNNEASLKEAERQLNEILAFRAKVAEESRPIEVRLKEAQDNEAVRKKIFDFYDEAMTLAARWQEANDNINFATGQSEADLFFERTSKELDDLKKQVEENPYDINLRLEYDEKLRIYNEMVDMRNQWQRSGLFNIPFTFTVNYASAQNAFNAARDKAKGLAGQQAKQTTLQEDYNAAAKAYKDAAAEVNRMKANRSAYTKAQWETAQTNLKDAKQKYSDLGGDPDGRLSRKSTSTAKKLQNDRQQRAKEEAKYQELLKQQKAERERAIKDMEFSTRQAQIDAMDDGTEKTIKQLALDFEKQKEEIERGYADIKQKKIDDARAAFEANPANKGKVFNPSSVNTKYTQAETDNYRELLKANQAEYDRALAEQRQTQRQYLLDYIKEYGSIQERRKAITEEYDAKIAKMSDEAQKATLQKQKENLLSELNMQEVQQSIDWETVFGDLTKQSTSALQSLRVSLKKALDMKDISAENAKVLAEKILEIENTISDRTDIWSSLFPALKERQRLTQAAKDAEEEYNRQVEKSKEALASVNSIQNEIVEQIKSAVGENVSVDVDLKENMPESKSEIMELYGIDEASDAGLALVKAFERLQIATTNLSKSEEDKAKAKTKSESVNDLLKGSSSVGDIMKNAVSSAGGGAMGVVSLVNQNAQSMAETVDKLGLETTDFGQAVHGFADGVGGFSSAIQSLASGDIFGAVNGVLDGIAGFGRMGINALIGQGNEAEKEAEIAELSKSQERLSDSIDRLADNIGKSDATNEESLEYFRKAFQSELEWEDMQRRKIDARASEYANSSYGFLGLSGKGSFNSHMANNGWEGWQVFSNILKQHLGENGVNHSSVNKNSIWSLTPEEMALLKQFAPKEWEALFNGDGHRNPEDLVNEYIDRAGKLEELTSSMNEKLTGYSWDGFLDAYKSMLKDLDSTTEDFADHIQELISNSLIESFVNSEAVKGKINELYKNIAKYASDESEGGTTLTEGEINDIKVANDDIANTLLAWREAAQQAGLIKSSTPYEQDTSTGGWQSMGQETAEELNGRFTALQMSGERISEGIVTTIATLTALSATVTGNGITLVEIRNLMITNNAFLEDLLSVNKEYYKTFDKKLDKITVNTK